MIGAIIGDIVGSRFEFNNIKSKDFEFFHEDCDYTDDTILTLAIANVFLCECLRHKPSGDTMEVPLHRAKKQSLNETIIMFLKMYAAKYPHPYGGYGKYFNSWAKDLTDFKPYYSCGNGSAMRVSSVAYASVSLEEVKDYSLRVTQPTHNHPEGIKGAEATAVATFLALHNMCKEDIKEYIESEYYKINFTLDEIRPTYRFDGTCQGTVPQALQCFFESDSFEDAIRNAISIGGDSDTIGAITGAVAGAYYGVPRKMRSTALSYLNGDLLTTYTNFEYPLISRFNNSEYLESDTFQKRCGDVKRECQEVIERRKRDLPNTPAPASSSRRQD